MHNMTYYYYIILYTYIYNMQYEDKRIIWNDAIIYNIINVYMPLVTVSREQNKKIEENAFHKIQPHVRRF